MYRKWLKPLFDRIVSLILLILFLPVFLLIAIGIKLSSKGPIFYKSVRVKQFGKLFDCYKFRTMHLDAEKQLEELLSRHNVLQEQWKKYRKLKKDPRLTPIGSFLRKSSLDELPQLFNVLKGDLSLVGPRPYDQNELNLFPPLQREALLSLKPGITGLWQTSGRNELDLFKRFDLDLTYLKTCSLWTDLILLIKTIPTVASAKGAY